MTLDETVHTSQAMNLRKILCKKPYEIEGQNSPGAGGDWEVENVDTQLQNEFSHINEEHFVT
jgi:hypothetical protein